MYRTSRYWTFRADSHSPTARAVSTANSVKTGMARTAAVGLTVNQPNTGPAAIITNHQAERHQEVDEPRQDRGHRDDQPGKVDLGDQPLLGHQAVARLGQGVGEQLPGKQGRQDEQGVRLAVGRQLAELAEEDGEDHHGEQRLEDRPGHPQSGLLVPQLDVAQGQEPEQLPVPPDLPQVDRPPAPAGANAGDLRRGPACVAGIMVSIVAIKLKPSG